MQADEFFLELEIEPLDEVGYVATSRDLPGLVAQGRNLAETLEIAQDVARKLVESHIEHGDPLPSRVRAALRRTRRSAKVTIPVGVSTVPA
jgi:predicted RNase H-like HicB family nuclease